MRRAVLPFPWAFAVWALLLPATLRLVRGEQYLCDLNAPLMMKVLHCVRDHSRPEIARVVSKFSSNGALLTRALCGAGASIDGLLSIVYPQKFIDEIEKAHEICRKKLL